MRSPILGGFYKSWSLNLADQQCINLFPTTVDSKTGKDVGALYSTPGLLLQAVCGGGDIRGMQVMNGLLYVVSGGQIFSVMPTMAVTLLGGIDTNIGPVSMINNGNQLVVFDGQNGYLVPGGAPLSGGAVATGGTNYAAGDLIYLQSAGGTQNATAVIRVSTVSTGAVTAYTVVQGGAFSPVATSFSQQSTTGSGSGFTITSPTFGAAVGIYTLTLPFTDPTSAMYVDGFGLVSQGSTQEFWQSNLFDLSIWNALNFSSADSDPTDIVALAELHEECFVFKGDATEVWINAGQAGFSFQRLAGVHIEMGCAAPFSVALAGEALIFLGQNDQGNGGVYTILGYEPKKISTKAMDGVIQGYSTISDAIAYVYEQDGHLFYVINFPTANATWVYDAAVGLWHQRAAFSNGQFSRHWGNCYALFGNLRMVGDYRNGNLYSYSMDQQTDNNTPKKWVRSWRALEKPSYVPVTFSALQIDMQTGIKVPAGTNPQVVLRHSDDGGHNWSSDRFLPAGKVGQTAIRVMARRLGSTRFNSGLDRIFELSGTDPMPAALISADLT